MILRTGIAIFAFGLGAGCSTSPNWFGAGEATARDWEIERVQAEVETGELAASIRGPMYTRVRRILKVLTPADRDRLANIDIVILTAPQSLFVFESGFDTTTSPPTPLIRTSSASLVGLNKVSMAQSVGTLADKDGSWLFKYLLYMRAIPDGGTIVDPLRASGVVSGGVNGIVEIDRASYERVWNDAQIVFDNMLTFLLAHEMAHLVSPRLPKGTFDSEMSYEQRVRDDEARADREALKMLAAVEETQTGADKSMPLYLLGAPVVFFQWIVTMEGSRRSLHPRTHPLDHSRAELAVLEIKKLLSGLPLTPSERASFPKVNEEALQELSAIKKAGVENYFASLDEQSRRVTIESLRFVPSP